MIHILQKSETYNKAVKIIDNEQYTIDLNKIENDSAIVCPFDKDMKCGKDKDGKVFIEKKTIISKPFK